MVLYLLQERGELCRALLYAVVLSPVLLTPTALAELLGLLDSLAAKLKEKGGPGVLCNMLHCCYNIPNACVSYAARFLQHPAYTGQNMLMHLSVCGVYNSSVVASAAVWFSSPSCNVCAIITTTNTCVSPPALTLLSLSLCLAALCCPYTL
jgi:hypothetical protein